MGLLLLILACSCKNNHPPQMVHSYAIRLKPGQLLKESLQELVQQHQIRAGWIGTCVGSLTDYQIRLANQPEAATGSGHFEIVSLTGTLSVNGSHLHISLSDSTGKTIGGHLMGGCRVYTTAEIVVLASDEFEFSREKDGTTPWEELQVKPARTAPNQ